jgi:hypothetical protein
MLSPKFKIGDIVRPHPDHLFVFQRLDAGITLESELRVSRILGKGERILLTVELNRHSIDFYDFRFAQIKKGHPLTKIFA